MTHEEWFYLHDQLTAALQSPPVHETEVTYAVRYPETNGTANCLRETAEASDPDRIGVCLIYGADGYRFLFQPASVLELLTALEANGWIDNEGATQYFPITPPEERAAAFWEYVVRFEPPT